MTSRNAKALTSLSSAHRGRRADVDLDPASEGTLPTLVVPSFNPSIWAQIAVHVLEVLAHLIALALHLFAAVKVQIALVAVLGLIAIRESRIEGSRLQWKCTGCCWGHVSDSIQGASRCASLNGNR